MVKVAYLLLCHKNPARVIDQARVLTSRGDYLAIHVDGNASPVFFDKVRQALADNPSVVFAERVKCGWGEWSLVEASINMLRAAETQFADATHFFLMSGDCMPIKPAHVIHDYLARLDGDMIEHADFFKDNWIKTGMKEDRLVFRHWFNERSSKDWFYRSLDWQRRLNLRRNIPKDLRMRIGSQWFALRRSTVETILTFIKARRDVIRFFKTTWIPDETFFQTLTMHLVPREEVTSRPPTLLMFSDYGMPVTFHSDHFEMLKSQDALFARKISENNDGLRDRLGKLFQSDEAVEVARGSGVALYDYVRKRGRVGRRFGGRIWETGAQIGPDHDLTIVLCKKWHIANRLIETMMRDNLGRGFGYVFDQDDVSLPPLGNLGSSTAKRGRHRRAFLKLLYEIEGTRSLAFCLDPSNLDAVRDLSRDGCRLRLLEIRCDFSDEWLSGHAERIGLGDRSHQGGLRTGLMKTLRQNIEDEQTDLRALNLPDHYRISQGEDPGRMARPLADAFGISVDGGAKLARTPNLFDD